MLLLLLLLRQIKCFTVFQSASESLLDVPGPKICERKRDIVSKRVSLSFFHIIVSPFFTYSIV